MGSRRMITAALALGTAVAIAPGAGAATTAKKVTKDTCTIDAIAQGAPNPSGIQFGFVNCPHSFGRGLHYDSYTVTPGATPGQGTVAGRFKNYYNRGTQSGTFALTVSATSPTNITFTGTVKHTSGTGVYTHVRGGGTIVCTSTDGGTHKACKVTTKLTGV